MPEIQPAPIDLESAALEDWILWAEPTDPATVEPDDKAGLINLETQVARIRRARNISVGRLGTYLRALRDANRHIACGFSSFKAYVATRLRLSPTAAYEAIALVEAFPLNLLNQYGGPLRPAIQYVRQTGPDGLKRLISYLNQVRGRFNRQDLAGRVRSWTGKREPKRPEIEYTLRPDGSVELIISAADSDAALAHIDRRFKLKEAPADQPIADMQMSGAVYSDQSESGRANYGPQTPRPSDASPEDNYPGTDDGRRRGVRPGELQTADAGSRTRSDFPPGPIVRVVTTRAG